MYYFDIIGIEEKYSFEFWVSCSEAGCVVRGNEFRGHGAEELQRSYRAALGYW